MTDHIERRHDIVLAGPVDRVFPLFTPVGERDWVPGWNPEFLHPQNGATREGMVFRTGQGEEMTIWGCVEWNPAAHRARYVRVTPASRFGFVDVACTALPEGGTRATVSYAFTALTADGGAVLDGLTSAAFAEMIDEWATQIDRWLAAKP